MTTQRIAQRKLVGFATDLVVQDGDTAYDTPAEVAAIVQLNTAVTTAFSVIWQMGGRRVCNGGSLYAHPTDHRSGGTA